MEKIYDIAIIGTGPAGLSAGLYASRAKLNTLLLEKESFGGQVMNIELVENYPGLVNIEGKELGANMLTQIRQFDSELVLAEVNRIKIEDALISVEAGMDRYRCNALIIASGSHPKKLGVPGEQEYADKGVFYCAACDGARFANKVVAVAGGGNSAITEALNLTRIVSEIIIIEIMPELSATSVLCDKVFSNPKIEVLCGVKIEAIWGDDRVKSLDLLDMETQRKGTLDVDGILVHIGRKPNTAFLDGVAPSNEEGFIIVNDRMETEIPGIYAAGDVRLNSPMQIISACGDGAAAALSVIKYLNSK